jgi:hypothetical protein
MSYKFIPNTGNQYSNDDYDPGYIDFFQVSLFMNKKKKYHLKRFTLDSNNRFRSIKEYYLSTEQMDKFYKLKNQNSYKVFSTYNLNDISYPTSGDICLARSPILSQNTTYDGFARI